MASATKQNQQLARQLFKLSLINGELSSEHVAGVLQYVAAHEGANAVAVLKAYQRLVRNEVARTQAVVEHAGSIGESTLAGITASMSRHYNRRISGVTRRNDALLAGLRVRVGDDVYESSVAGQLAALAASV